MNQRSTDFFQIWHSFIVIVFLSALHHHAVGFVSTRLLSLLWTVAAFNSFSQQKDHSVDPLQIAPCTVQRCTSLLVCATLSFTLRLQLPSATTMESAHKCGAEGNSGKKKKRKAVKYIKAFIIVAVCGERYNRKKTK